VTRNNEVGVAVKYAYAAWRPALHILLPNNSSEALTMVTGTDRIR